MKYILTLINNKIINYIIKNLINIEKKTTLVILPIIVSVNMLKIYELKYKGIIINEKFSIYYLFYPIACYFINTKNINFKVNMYTGNILTSKGLVPYIGVLYFNKNLSILSDIKCLNNLIILVEKIFPNEKFKLIISYWKIYNHFIDLCKFPRLISDALKKNFNNPNALKTLLVTLSSNCILQKNKKYFNSINKKYFSRILFMLSIISKTLGFVDSKILRLKDQTKILILKNMCIINLINLNLLRKLLSINLSFKTIFNNFSLNPKYSLFINILKNISNGLKDKLIDKYYSTWFFNHINFYNKEMIFQLDCKNCKIIGSKFDNLIKYYKNKQISTIGFIIPLWKKKY